MRDPRAAARLMRGPSLIGAGIPNQSGWYKASLSDVLFQWLAQKRRERKTVGIEISWTSEQFALEFMRQPQSIADLLEPRVARTNSIRIRGKVDGKDRIVLLAGLVPSQRFAACRSDSIADEPLQRRGFIRAHLFAAVLPALRRIDWPPSR